MTAASGVTLRTAVAGDAAALAVLIRTAYRGDQGWTNEAHFFDDERIDAAGVLAKIDGDGLVLVAESDDTSDGSRIVACCELAHRDDGVAYFGLFAVSPEQQSAGLGRRVLAAAEQLAVSRWSARTMEMHVVAQRPELLAWYERRGYRRTGRTHPFPYDQLVNGTAFRHDLYFAVLTKSLEAAPDAGSDAVTG